MNALAAALALMLTAGAASACAVAEGCPMYEDRPVAQMATAEVPETAPTVCASDPDGVPVRCAAPMPAPARTSGPLMRLMGMAVVMLTL